MTEGVDLVFPAGTTIPARGYPVFTESLKAFEAVYPGVAAIEWTGGGLNNSGEEIALETPGGVEVDVDFTSWKVSAATGGSPGAANVLVDSQDPETFVDLPVAGSFVSGDPLVVDGSAFDDVAVDVVRVRFVRDVEPSFPFSFEYWCPGSRVASRCRPAATDGVAVINESHYSQTLPPWVQGIAY